MKKGFTLVELMATIVILSIITMIGVGTYQKASKNIKEQEYKNKITYIESQAALYASETGYLSTNVNHLVELGYVEADNDKGEVISPVDNKKLNDYVVTISREGENYYGHFTDKEESDLNNIDMTNENLEIIVETVSSEKILAVNEWTIENVKLTAQLKNTSIDLSKIKKITWYNNVKISESEINNNFLSHDDYLVEVSQILNSMYRVEIEFTDGTKYEARRTIKIDKQASNVYKEDVRIEGENDYTNTNKKTRILASDQNGSGIAGYYVGTYSDCTKNSFAPTTSESYEVDLSNGTYYVCAKDQVGNISKAISFNIDKVDSDVPTCKIIVNGKQGENGWYIGDLTFSLEASDTGSGIKTKEISATELKSDSGSFTVTAKVRDNAGNECYTEEYIKRDSTPPICNWNDASYYNNWTNSNRTVTVTCRDNESGCISSTYSKSWAYTSGTHSTESLSYVIKDQAGNTTTCSKSANVYVDKDAPSTPTGGAIGTVSGSNTTGTIQTAASGSTDTGSGVKEYRYLVTNTSSTPTNKSSFTTSMNFTRSCGTSYYAWALAVDSVGNMSGIKSLGSTSDAASVYSDWSSCSKACNTGTQTRTNSCALITTDLSQECNTQKCCSSVYYETSDDCSEECDGGQYIRKAYSNYDNRRCSSKDKEDGGSCNTQACPSDDGGDSGDSGNSETCTATCHIRGTTKRNSGNSWTCNGHGHTVNTHYYIYCRDTACNVTKKTTSPTWVCGESPYTEADGWELYPDSHIS